MTSQATNEAAAPPPSDARFQILALDGGGAKALFTANVLAHVEADLGITISDHFDLIAGTSAGGIVALGLGSGLRPAEIAEHFADLVDKVFPPNRQRRARLGRLSDPAYDSDVLREVLSEVLGDRALGQSRKRLVIPAWDLQRGDVHIFKTPHHDRLARDWTIPMVDVAMATTAAPTYFPAANVQNTPLIDGGVWANNPSVVAIAEAVSMLDVPLDAIRVLNISTMEPYTDHSARLNHGGVLRWMTRAAPLILSATSRGGTGTARHLVGEEDFVRWDEPVPPGRFALDRINTTAVKGYAASLSRQHTPEFTAKFVDHTAAAYTPPPGRGGPTHTPTEEHH